MAGRARQAAVRFKRRRSRTEPRPKHAPRSTTNHNDRYDALLSASGSDELSTSSDSESDSSEDPLNEYLIRTPERKLVRKRKLDVLVKTRHQRQEKQATRSPPPSSLSKGDHALRTTDSLRKAAKGKGRAHSDIDEEDCRPSALSSPAAAKSLSTKPIRPSTLPQSPSTDQNEANQPNAAAALPTTPLWRPKPRPGFANRSRPTATPGSSTITAGVSDHFRSKQDDESGEGTTINAPQGGQGSPATKVAAAAAGDSYADLSELPFQCSPFSSPFSLPPPLVQREPSTQLEEQPPSPSTSRGLRLNQSSEGFRAAAAQSTELDYEEIGFDDDLDPGESQADLRDSVKGPGASSANEGQNKPEVDGGADKETPSARQDASNSQKETVLQRNEEHSPMMERPPLRLVATTSRFFHQTTVKGEPQSTTTETKADQDSGENMREQAKPKFVYQDDGPSFQHASDRSATSKTRVAESIVAPSKSTRAPSALQSTSPADVGAPSRNGYKAAMVQSAKEEAMTAECSICGASFPLADLDAHEAEELQTLVVHDGEREIEQALLASSGSKKSKARVPPGSAERRADIAAAVADRIAIRLAQNAKVHTQDALQTRQLGDDIKKPIASAHPFRPSARVGPVGNLAASVKPPADDDELGRLLFPEAQRKVSTSRRSRKGKEPERRANDSGHADIDNDDIEEDADEEVSVIVRPPQKRLRAIASSIRPVSRVIAIDDDDVDDVDGGVAISRGGGSSASSKKAKKGKAVKAGQLATPPSSPAAGSMFISKLAPDIRDGYYKVLKLNGDGELDSEEDVQSLAKDVKKKAARRTTPIWKPTARKGTNRGGAWFKRKPGPRRK